MDKPKFSEYKKRFFILASAVLFFVAVCLCFLFWVQHLVREHIYADIDKRLLTVAESIQLILPEDYHLRAKTAAAISSEEYQAVESKLTALARTSGAKYVWTDVLVGDTVHLTTCNKTSGPDNPEAEIYYFMAYQDGVSDAQMLAFSGDEPVFTTFQDIWGQFRAVFVPVKNSDGSVYLACAEFTVDYVEAIISRSNLFFLAGLIVFGLGSLPLCLLYMAGNSHHRKLLEEKNAQLEQSRKRLRATLHSIGDGVLVTDQQGCISHMNPVAENLTGWAVADATGQPHQIVLNFVADDDKGKDLGLVEHVFTHKTAVSFNHDLCLLTKAGNHVEVIASAAPIAAEDDGDISGSVLVLRDVTERNKLNEKLNAGRKMEAIGVLASGIAHDFNNMLGGIIGAAELINQSQPENPKICRMNKIILDSASRAAELAKQLLSFSRKTTSAAQVLDMHSLIDETILLLGSSIDKRIEVRTDLQAEQHNIQGDPSLLQNSLLNLGINAAHAMPDGGVLTIASRVLELDLQEHTASEFKLKPGLFMEISVSDNGCGIAKEHIERIFEPFFTTKEKGQGTGLGLASVYGTVKQHQGAVTVYSEAGVGTVFKLLFPITTNKVATQLTTEAIPGSGNILLIDDDETMRLMGKAMLEKLGYQVRLATNGLEGFELFKAYRDEIDLVIVDMMMPVMNGRECFEKIRAIDPQATVILASGFSDEEDLKCMMQAGLKGFIQKPYFNSILSQMVSKVLQERHAS